MVGRLGRCLGMFDNQERRHRTRVFVLVVKDLLDQYEDRGRRKRKWFQVGEAMEALQKYKPLHCNYLRAMGGSREEGEEEKTAKNCEGDEKR